MAGMSPTVANDLVISFTALLTLLLAALLVRVIRLPPSPPLNPAAKQKLDELDTQFEDELRTDARVRARACGRKGVKKKDIRVEYRKRRVWKASRVLTGATRYGGITISGAGLAIVVPSLPHFPPISSAFTRFLGAAGAIVAAMAMVWDGSEFLRGTLERRHESRNRIGISAEEYGQLPALLIEPISERAEKELRLCCKRLAKDVEKEARRWAGEEEITLEDIGEAWGKLVTSRVLAIPAVRSRKVSVLLDLATLVELIAVAGILYLIFLSLVKTKLPTGQYWPVVVTVAALLVLYLVLLNGPRAMAAAWKRRRIPLTIIRTLASGLWGSLAWLVQKGPVLVGDLFRIRPRDKDPDIAGNISRTRPGPGKEGLVTAESVSDRDNGVGTEMASQASQFMTVQGSGKAEAYPMNDFSAHDPSSVNRTIPLQVKFNRYYKGIVLFGRCPRCAHDDGINVFIPNTWATVGGTAAQSTAYIQPKSVTGIPAIEATAQQAIEGYAVEGWVSYTSEPWHAGTDEIVEVIVCRCGHEHDHQPPSGRSGCGYWAYLHLLKGTIRNDRSAG